MTPTGSSTSGRRNATSTSNKGVAALHEPFGSEARRAHPAGAYLERHLKPITRGARDLVLTAQKPIARVGCWSSSLGGGAEPARYRVPSGLSQWTAPSRSRRTSIRTRAPACGCFYVSQAPKTEASRSLNSLRDRCRFRQRLISRGLRPSAVRLAA